MEMTKTDHRSKQRVDAMAKTKKHPRYNVVSVRVSDEERELLEKMSLEENKKVSDLIREALKTIAPPKKQ